MEVSKLVYVSPTYGTFYHTYLPKYRGEFVHPLIPSVPGHPTLWLPGFPVPNSSDGKSLACCHKVALAYSLDEMIQGLSQHRRNADTPHMNHLKKKKGPLIWKKNELFDQTMLQNVWKNVTFSEIASFKNNDIMPGV